jgi:integrase
MSGKGTIMVDMQGNAEPGRAWDGAGESGETEQPANPVEGLLARSAKRRQQQSSDPERHLGSWFDPDPEAASKLPAHRHPVTRLLETTRPNRRSRKTSEVRTTYRLLTGAPGGPVAWDDVLAYPWHQITPDAARELYRAIKSRYSNRNTRHGYITITRAILRQCRAAKLISAGRYAELVEELPTSSLRGATQHRRRLTPAEIGQLMAACSQGTPLRAARDSAMLAVFVTTGMRVGELARLDLSDWDRDNDLLTLRDTKNGRDHEVPVDPRTARFLHEWLAYRGTAAGPLFVSTEGMPVRLTRLTRLSTHAVRARAQLWAERAGIGHLTTHDFRRTVASILLRTTDASLVGRLLNHTDLATTLVYDITTEEEQRGAISTLPLPEPPPDTDEQEDGDQENGRVAS